MPEDYYQNILYPFQDRILKIVENSPVGFYLTGGTVLSRVYLHHRNSDDLDFFVNGATDFKEQIKKVIMEFQKKNLQFDAPVAEEDFVRLFLYSGECSLKLDFVNDVQYRSGIPFESPIFIRTDNIQNILSNKLSALTRYASKDIVDIVFICKYLKFNWDTVFDDASEKDLWVSPVNVAEIMEQFPVEKIDEINWITFPGYEQFKTDVRRIIPDILEGRNNSLFINSPRVP